MSNIEQNLNPSTESIEPTFKFLYQPPENRQIVVARVNGSGDQYLIGPEPTIEAIHQALILLQDLGRNVVATLTVIVAPEYRTAHVHETPPVDQPTQVVFKRFGIIEQLKGGGRDVEDYKDSLNLNYIGVRPDVRKPLHVTTNYAHRFSPELMRVIYAMELTHEWQHVLQIRNQLPIYSLWSEVNAIAAQIAMLERIQALDISDEVSTFMAKYLPYFRQLKYNYEQGLGFEGHITEDRFESSPPGDVEVKEISP